MTTRIAGHLVRHVHDDAAFPMRLPSNLAWRACELPHPFDPIRMSNCELHAGLIGRDARRRRVAGCVTVTHGEPHLFTLVSRGRTGGSRGACRVRETGHAAHTRGAGVRST
jgi:hypothetical protein